MTGSQLTALKCPQCGATLPPVVDIYIVCQYCGSSLVYSGEKPNKPDLAPEAMRGMRLKMFVYTDSQGTGLEMFRMLAPQGWQIQGGCRWLLDNPGMPAVVSITLGNPQGAEVFEILPNLNFTWNANPMSLMMHPPGSKYFGAEVRPPMPVLEAFHQIVLPRYRNSQRDLQILHEELQPDLPRLVKSEAAISGGWAEGAKMRIRYSTPSGPIEEEIYGVVEVFRAPIVTMAGAGEVFFWWVDFLFSFRTAFGRLDATADLFSVMINSFKLNPEWAAAYKSITQYLAQQQIQRIRSIGQVGEILRRTGESIRQQNLQDWYARQQVYDQMAVDRSRAIRDVQAFQDPFGKQEVELPATYGHAWANALGEYILTDDAGYNPNRESGQNWEEMVRK